MTEDLTEWSTRSVWAERIRTHGDAVRQMRAEGVTAAKMAERLQMGFHTLSKLIAVMRATGDLPPLTPADMAVRMRGGPEGREARASRRTARHETSAQAAVRIHGDAIVAARKLGLSRTEIAAETGLSMGTLCQVLTILIADGRVERREENAGTRRQRVIRYRAEGLCADQIAQRLGVPAGTIRSDLLRIEEAEARCGTRHTATATILGCRTTTTADSPGQAQATHDAMTAPPPRHLPASWRGMLDHLPNLGPVPLLGDSTRATDRRMHR